MIHQDLSLTVRDASSFFTSPLRFNQKEWLYAAGSLSGTALLYTTDETIRRNLGLAGNASHNGAFWEIPTVYGTTYFAGGLTLATYAAGLIADDDQLRTTGRLLAESLILSGIPTLVVKHATGRSRPFTNEGPWRFHGFQWGYEHTSFPSGHTATAFAVSTVLAERLDNIWARVGLYGLASLTALARVRNNQHWFSDVIVGAGLGLAAGLHATAREEQRQSSHSTSHRLTLYPSLNGLTLSYRIN